MPTPHPGGFFRLPLQTFEKPPSSFGETKTANENMITDKQVTPSKVSEGYGFVLNQKGVIPESDIVPRKSLHQQLQLNSVHLKHHLCLWL